MNIYNQIKNLESNAVRAFIKENAENTELFEEISQNKEAYLPFLLQHKAITDSILNCFVDDPETLLNSLIDYNFAPSMIITEKIIVNLNSNLDDLFLKFMNHFPSIPFKAEHLFLLLNQELLNCSEAILLKNPSYFEPRVLKNFISLNTTNETIISKIMEDENLSDSLLRSLLDDLNIEKQNKQFQLLYNKFLSKLCEFGESSRYQSSDQWTELLKKFTLTEDQWKTLTYSIFSQYNTHYKREVNYSKNLEQAYDILKNKKITFLSEVPKGSKFRLKYIIQNPKEMDNDELMENIVKENCHSNICLYALSLPLETLKKVNVEALNKLMPASVRDTLIFNRSEDGHLDKVKYLLSELNSKFSKYLREMLSVEDANKVKGKKKSYFTEILSSIDARDFESFQSNLQYGYSLDQFCKDTFQKSKSEGSSLVSASLEFLSQMTKEDILMLASSNIKFVSCYDEDLRSKFKFDLTKTELLTLINKIDIQYLYPLAKRKEDLIEIAKESKDEDYLNSIFDQNKTEIIKDPKILSLFLKNKNEKLKVSLETFTELSKNFDRKNILTNFELESLWNLSEIFMLKDVNGVFIYELSDIIEQIKSNQDLIEDESVLKVLKSRDKAFYENLLNAYLGGNKEMTNLFGHSIKIRRSKTELISTLLETSNVNSEDLLEKAYHETKDFYEFKNKVVKFVSTEELISFCKGKSFTSQNLDSSDVCEILDQYHIQLKLGSLELKDNFDISDIKDKNVSIESIDINRIDSDFNLSSLKKIIIDLKNPKVIGGSFDINLSLIKLGIDFQEREATAKNIYDLLIENSNNFKIEDVPLYESLGLIFDNNILEEILSSHDDDKEVINWVSERIGSLSFYFINEDYIYDKSVKDLLASKGANILSSSDFKFHGIVKKIKESGQIEDPVHLYDLSLKQKSDLILFIEEEIDPNYKKLNLLKENLEELETIFPFHQMVTLASYSNEDLIKLFSIAPEIYKNPKLIPAIQQLLSIKGLQILNKVKLFSDLINTKGFESDLLLSDFIDYSDIKNLKFTESFLSWSSENLALLAKLDLYFDSKKSLVRFLNSLVEHGDNYLKDIEGMIRRILSELENLKYRLENNLQSEEERKDLDSSIKGIESRLVHIKGLDRASDVHDRLITLSGFIKEDPLQLIGQDKFIGLETPEVTLEFGHKLFFPKNRAEVQELGNTHGWCVSANSSYADNVISKKNVLVAVAPKNSEGLIKDVVALAHFNHNGNNKYSLEQFKWSAKVKGRQVDAKSNFNYKHLIEIIEAHLAKKGNKDE